MADGQATTPQPLRSWREIAEQLAREKDSARILELSVELTHALDLELPIKRKSA